MAVGGKGELVFPRKTRNPGTFIGKCARKVGALLAASQMGALSPLGSTNYSEMISSPTGVDALPPLRPLGPHMGGQREKDNVRLCEPPNDPPVTVGFSRGDLAGS